MTTAFELKLTKNKMSDAFEAKLYQVNNTVLFVEVFKCEYSEKWQPSVIVKNTDGDVLNVDVVGGQETKKAAIAAIVEKYSMTTSNTEYM